MLADSKTVKQQQPNSSQSQLVGCNTLSPRYKSYVIPATPETRISFTICCRNPYKNTVRIMFLKMKAFCIYMLLLFIYLIKYKPCHKDVFWGKHLYCWDLFQNSWDSLLSSPEVSSPFNSLSGNLHRHQYKSNSEFSDAALCLLQKISA